MIQFKGADYNLLASYTFKPVRLGCIMVLENSLWYEIITSMFKFFTENLTLFDLLF